MGEKNIEKKKNILVVDDSALMRRVTSDIINKDSRFCVTDFATNGFEALDIIYKNYGKYDAVVCDINMPKMTGIDVLRTLERHKIDIRVVMSSTMTLPGAKETILALELGAFDFVTKPSSYLKAVNSEFGNNLMKALYGACNLEDEWDLEQENLTFEGEAYETSNEIGNEIEEVDKLTDEISEQSEEQIDEITKDLTREIEIQSEPKESRESKVPLDEPRDIYAGRTRVVKDSDLAKTQPRDNKVETKVKPRVETKTRSKVESKTKTEIDSKVKSRHESKVESKTVLKPEPKVEPKTELKAEPKVEPKTVLKPEPKAEPKTVLKPEPKAEPKTRLKPEPKVEPKTRLKPEPKVEPKTRLKSEPKVEPKTRLKPEPKAEPKTILNTESNIESKTETQEELKKDAKKESKRGHKKDKITPNYGMEKIVVIASSTGGPKALAKVIPKLDAHIDAPIVLVQHMPEGFTSSLAARLDEISHVKVVEAVDGEPLSKGTVYIAKGGRHLKILEKDGQAVLKVYDGPAIVGLKPCADITIESLNNVNYKEMLFVVMTGMGQDGTKGLTALKNTIKKKIIVQDQKSSAVYGMPRAVANAGLADGIFALDKIAKEINQTTGVRKHGC